MISKYIKGRDRQAEDREIKTTIYHILLNTEVIGLQTMDHDMLISRCAEHLDELRLGYTTERITFAINDMLMDDTLYRVSNDNGYRVGLSK